MDRARKGSQHSHQSEASADPSDVSSKTVGIHEMHQKRGRGSHDSWKRILRLTLQVILLLVAVFSLYTFWFINGKPVVKQDYVILLNQISRPENQSLENNAWPHYEKAVSLFQTAVESRSILDWRTKRFTDLSESEQKTVEKWVQQNEKAWQQFLIACSKPYCWREYRPLDPNDELSWGLDVPTMRVDATHLTPLRRFMDLGVWHSRVQMQHGQTQQAMDDCLALIRAGRHWCEDKLLIEYLLGLAMIHHAHREILNILSARQLSADELENLRQRLISVYRTDWPTFSTEIERLIFLDVVQHAFTGSGLGGGHLIPENLTPLVQVSSIVKTLGELETKPTLKQQLLYIDISMLHARRSRTIGKYNQLLDKVNAMMKMTPFERHADNISLDLNRPHVFNYKIYFDSFFGQSRYFIIGLLMPAVDHLLDIVCEKQAMHEATLTIVALQRWHADTGEYPEALNELVKAGYLKKLPADPYGHRPLVYTRIDEDFTLYSVGRNFKDDGGRLGHLGSYVRTWGTEKDGDAVFWPVHWQRKPEN